MSTETTATETRTDVIWRVWAHDAAVNAYATVPTRSDAEYIAAQFPKWVKVRGGHLTAALGDYTVIDGRVERTSRDGSYLNGSELWGHVSIHVGLSPNGVRGAENETGAKRWRRFVAVVENMGGTFDYAVFGNSITADALRAKVGL